MPSHKFTMDLPTTVNTTTFLIATAATLALTLLWWRSTRRPPDIPPGPGPALPIIGHFYLLEKDPRNQFRTWRKQYGDIFSLYMGSRLMVVLNGYQIIREALVKNSDFFSDRPNESMFDLVTKAKGIGDTSGPLWKAQRTTTLEILRHLGMGKNRMAEKIQEEIKEFIKVISSKKAVPFDPSRLVQVSLSNNICSITFGKRFDYDDQHFLHLMESMEEMFILGGGASVLAFLPFLRYVPGDPFHIRKAMDCYNYIVDTFLVPAIEQHMTYDDEGKEDDFISAYLRECKMAPERDTAEFINEFNLQKVVMDLFAAGTDTSATAIRWALIYFLHYPEVQERCYQDIVQIVGNPATRTIELADRAGMIYLEATISEVLRMGEVVPLGVIHAPSCALQFRGYTIPEDAYVLPNLDSLLHDPSVWDEPEKFCPERFIGVDGKLVRMAEFLPFSIGRRVCLGESLARSELFLYLSTMIQRFRFLPPEDGQLPSLQGDVGLVHAPRPFLLRAVPRN